MDDAKLLQACDLNYLEFNRESARSTSGGLVHEEAGLAFYVPGHRFPVGFTGVMRLDADLAADEAIERARAFFGPRGLGFTFCLAMHRDADLAAALEAAGTDRMSNSPGMVLDKRLEDAPPPPGVTVEKVQGDTAVRDFADVTGAAYATLGMPPKFAAAQFADPRFFDQPHVAAFLARVGDAAAASAMVVVSHGVAGIYWVGTSPEARGRGLAELCTRIAGNAGLDMGARFVALQASTMGEPVYRRMGYREVTRYPWYVEIP